jgi:hypothetical protein
VKVFLDVMKRPNEIIAIGCCWCMGDLGFLSTRRPVDANDDEVAGQTPWRLRPKLRSLLLLQPRASARMNRSDVRPPPTQLHSHTIAFKV